MQLTTIRKERVSASNESRAKVLKLIGSRLKVDNEKNII